MSDRWRPCLHRLQLQDLSAQATQLRLTNQVDFRELRKDGHRERTDTVYDLLTLEPTLPVVTIQLDTNVDFEVVVEITIGAFEKDT